MVGNEISNTHHHRRMNTCKNACMSTNTHTHEHKHTHIFTLIYA